MDSADPRLVNPHKTKRKTIYILSKHRINTSIIDEFTVMNHRNGGYHGKFGRESKMQWNYHIECSTKEYITNYTINNIKRQIHSKCDGLIGLMKLNEIEIEMKSYKIEQLK